ncbi:MAG: glycolate oxidase subunit GlcE [Gammaproteobacteria bacterium]|nr:glycolate oxidase subunit GlcE [Gammaproteobacteria bacterium]
MADFSISELLQTQVQIGIEQKQPLRIVGSGSKTFLGRESYGEPINVSNHRGIIDYDPRELVLTARSGALLSEIERTLAESNQMLAFEPPYFGNNATLGGTIASDLSGPRRPYAGSGRDYVLGCKILNGKAEILQFGGKVMKNVAGYDLSRLMAGAFGTLGILLEISLKVLPRPAASVTLVYECNQADAIHYMSGLLSQSLPIDGACYYAGHCYVRISGSEQAVKEAQRKLRGDISHDAHHFWQQLREHELPFFKRQLPLWRLAVKPATPPLAIIGDWLPDWGGAQRWLISDTASELIRDTAHENGGHASLFRGGDRHSEIFQPLAPAMHALQQRIKASFDPHSIFNRGRMYATI